MLKKAAVIGYPVKHSLSPRLHNYWLKKYNIKGEYTAIEVPPEGLAEFISTMAANGFCGVNLTIPHKEAVMDLLDYIDDNAKKIGAVNTIVVKAGKLFGKNTDAYGFSENISSSHHLVISSSKAVVLGAGGAAKAVIFALQQLGFKEIIITNRTRARAEELVSSYQRTLVSSITIAEWNDRNNILENADLLVNTTSLGMTGKEPLDIDLSLLPKTALVTDIVYSPLITPLLAQAIERGNPTVDGLGMLLHQAVPAFEAWFGVKPEVTNELREYVLQQLS